MKNVARYFAALLAFAISITIVPQKISAAETCPCDIYEAGGTPCVAAHSMVRALYSSYNGPLYQVKRTSDKQTRDIGILTPGGYANAAAQDSFLAGKPGTISIIYDQSPKANHLPVAPKGGYLPNGGTEANASDTSIMINGYKVYGLYIKPFWDTKRIPAGVYVCRLTIDGLEGWFGKVVIGK
jgi:hypothetical protein